MAKAPALSSPRTLQRVRTPHKGKGSSCDLAQLQVDAMTMPAHTPKLYAASMSWTVHDVLAATAGIADENLDRSFTFASVATDSRRIETGSLFVALRGERHDGHRFVSAALGAGAPAGVVDHLVDGLDPAHLIRVTDSLRALGDLAAWTRQQHPVRVVAITGSNGKTTTKELVAAICAAAD